MANAAVLAALSAAAGLVACLGTRALIPLLRGAAVLDRPNERSLHQMPVPRGGGIAVFGAITLAWLAFIEAGAAIPVLLWVLVSAVLLAAISWVDDLRGLPPAIRLTAHFVAVYFAIMALPAGPVFQAWDFNPWLDRVGAAVLLVWFLNLFNFMDGIDGLAGSEAAAIGVGLLLFALLGGVGGGGDYPGLAALAAAIVAASIGFLVWNWAPARIFLGDVGSVPLGYLLGFLLLCVAALGYWKIALILPLYFLADATITLCRRLLRGERVWRPHREHLYQRAVQRGLSHAAVVWRVNAANLLLIGCGLAAENGAGLAALAAAMLIVGLLLASLAGVAKAP